MSASRIELAVGLSLAVFACRFGGPTGDPSAPVDGVGVAGTGGAPGMDAMPDDDVGPDVDERADASDGAAGAGGDVIRDGGGGAATDGHAADAPADDGGCAPPFTSAVCDPVCNTGCAVLSRCDVGDAPRTGACIGIWISGEGSSCVKTSTTDPCATQLSCVSGTCRRLCYRDGDCTTAGTCCNTSIDVGGAPSGFRACTPCAPRDL
jgi:hypothetical protein